MENIGYAVFVIVVCAVLIWATGKTISDFKKKRATVTQIFQAILVDLTFFIEFFLFLIVPSFPVMWWGIAIVVCLALYIFSERVGDWIGKVYRKKIKPYKKAYCICGIVILIGLIVGSYYLAYITWKGAIRPGLLLSAVTSAIIAVIGFVVGLFGYANGLWRLFIKDRGEQEKKVVTVLSFFLVWALIGLLLGHFFHLTRIMCAVIGIVIIMYFMLPAWVGEYQGIMVGFIPSVLHIVSLLCIVALLLPLIAV